MDNGEPIRGPRNTRGMTHVRIGSNYVCAEPHDVTAVEPGATTRNGSRGDPARARAVRGERLHDEMRRPGPVTCGSLRASMSDSGFTALLERGHDDGAPPVEVAAQRGVRLGWVRL